MHVKYSEAELGQMIYPSIDVQNTDEFVAFQVDVLFPPDWELHGVNVLRTQGHEFTYHEVERGRVRILAYSFTNSPFVGNRGELIRLRLLPHQAGEYPIQLKDATLSSIEAINILDYTEDGYATIKEYPTHITAPTIRYVAAGIILIIIIAAGIYALKKQDR